MKLISGKIDVFQFGSVELDNDYNERMMEECLQYKEVHEVIKILPADMQVAFIRNDQVKASCFGAVACSSNIGNIVLLNTEHAFNVLSPAVENMPKSVVRTVFSAEIAGSLIHEGCHYRQMEDGRLQINDVGFITWEDELQFMPMTPIGYFDSPWEQEAYNTQAEFIEKFYDTPATHTMAFIKKHILSTMS